MPRIQPTTELVTTYTLIPRPLLTEVQELLFDPVRNKVRYGARSALINRLLREWVKEKKTEAKELRELDKLERKLKEKLND